jgi:hypothetical protein
MRYFVSATVRKPIAGQTSPTMRAASDFEGKSGVCVAAAKCESDVYGWLLELRTDSYTEVVPAPQGRRLW